MGHGGRRRCAAIAVACVLGMACHASATYAGILEFSAFDPSRFNLDVAISSDYVVNGVTRSQGKPIAQAQLGWMGDAGWTAGVWLSTANPNPGPGPTYELEPYVGKRWALDRNWSVRTDLTRYMFRPRAVTYHSPAYDYTELRGAMSFRDLVDVSVTWSPDYSGYSLLGAERNRTMLTYEAAARFPAKRWLTLSAGAGRRDLESGVGAGYWYWSAGAETAFDRMSFALSYIGTSGAALALYGDEYAGHRMVATVALHLR